jgi:eukaryotic-like serine/threonine-protein kinase
MNVQQNFTGELIEGWCLGEELGRGASAAVYKCTKDDRAAAIKVFFPEALQQHGGMEAELSRLELQLQLCDKPQHPNVVKILGGGSALSGRSLYIVMELAKGITLEEHCTSPVSILESKLILRQIVEGLKYLDSLGLVHRDIKPANVIYDRDTGIVKILDLGVVLNFDNSDASRLSGNRFVGTDRYSPPEFVWRLEEQSIDAWRAVTFYQVGAVMHDVLLGTKIFAEADQPKAKLYDAIRGLTPNLSRVQDPWLRFVIQSCLLKDWRSRIELLSWDSFEESEPGTFDLVTKLTHVKLRQKLAAEKRKNDKEKLMQTSQAGSTDQELWVFKEKLFLEIRGFIDAAHAFPKFSADEQTEAAGGYSLKLAFERQPEFEINELFSATIKIGSLVQNGLISVEFQSQGQFESQMHLRWMEPMAIPRVGELCNSALIQLLELSMDSNEGSKN